MEADSMHVDSYQSRTQELIALLAGPSSELMAWAGVSTPSDAVTCAQASGAASEQELRQVCKAQGLRCNEHLEALLNLLADTSSPTRSGTLASSVKRHKKRTIPRLVSVLAPSPEAGPHSSVVSFT